jgi:hypothetical protein
MVSRSTSIRLIPPIKEELSKLAETLYSKVIGKKSIGTYNGASIYHIGDAGIGYYLLIDKDTVAYFVKYTRVRFGGNHYARQILVWRNEERAVSARFATHVFFNILLPKFKYLISDQDQTSQGKRFWQVACDVSFERGFNVYKLDRSTTPIQLIKFDNKLEFIEGTRDLWGATLKDRQVLLIVTASTLSLRSAK